MFTILLHSERLSCATMEIKVFSSSVTCSIISIFDFCGYRVKREPSRIRDAVFWMLDSAFTVLFDALEDHGGSMGVGILIATSTYGMFSHTFIKRSQGNVQLIHTSVMAPESSHVLGRFEIWIRVLRNDFGSIVHCR